MGESITFPSNGGTCEGYLASPAIGRGPGLVVLQEWWGLVPHIKEVCDRFATEGFFALAPDIYRGASASNEEPDEAGKLMMSLNIEQAAKDMVAAVDEVARRATGSKGVGVTGFCMGGGLALWLASLRPGIVTAVAPFYGVLPWEAAKPDFTAITARVQGHYAADDSFASPEKVRELEAILTGAGIECEFFIYEGTDHAFFNDTRPDAHDPDASRQAWERVLPFFKSELM